jgi:acetolactate synthase-1/2/3 large subunit
MRAGYQPGGSLSMNGAESLVHTLLASGIDTCFANPGTSEMHFVAALDRIPGMRCVLGLFEGVVTGAADGYARISGRPAATLLHCAPGLGNGLANLHNGRRANTMMVNCVGDQATYHRPFDAPLTNDTEGWARGVSGWVRRARQAAEVGADAAVAVQAARTPPGQIATLILPSDTCWDEGGVVARPLPVPSAEPPPLQQIEAIARVLRRREPAVLVLGDKAMTAPTLADAHRIAAASGARLRGQMLIGRAEYGAGVHPIESVPYRVDRAVEALAGVAHVIVVGTPDPVGFFAYPGKPSRLYPDGAQLHVLARADQDVPAALAMLADALAAPAVPPPEAARPAPATGAVTSEALGTSLAALLPEGAIVIDEAITFATALFPALHAAPPFVMLSDPGGAIGTGLPLEVGAAVAAPGRRVVALQADGSAGYTLQALWTMARERLDVTVVLLANRKYAILQIELAAVGANPGRTALDMLDLGNPDIDWVRIAEGFGVAAARADTMERFNDLFLQANARSGPFLIELATG